MQESGLSPHAGVTGLPPPLVGLGGATVTKVVRVAPPPGAGAVVPATAHLFLLQVNWPSQSFSVWHGSPVVFVVSIQGFRGSWVR